MVCKIGQTDQDWCVLYQSTYLLLEKKTGKEQFKVYAISTAVDY